MLRDVNDSYEALTMDGELSYPEELQTEITNAQAKEDRGAYAFERVCAFVAFVGTDHRYPEELI